LFYVKKEKEDGRDETRWKGERERNRSVIK